MVVVAASIYKGIATVMDVKLGLLLQRCAEHVQEAKDKHSTCP